MARALQHSRPPTPLASDAVQDELVAELATLAPHPLGSWLAAFAGFDPERRALVTDLLGRTARWLAPADHPPADGDEAELWNDLVDALDRLHGSGVHPLGPPAFIRPALFDGLVEESRRQRPARTRPTTRLTGAAGDLLAALAVSRQLREAVSSALGCPVTPTYDALYEYDGPGSRVRTHVDARGYEFVFHLILEHACGGSGASESALIAHLPDRGVTAIRLQAGDGVVIRGRGTLHAWAPLGASDERSMIAVGFAPDSSGASPAR